MRENQVCPKCGGKDIIYFDPNKSKHKLAYQLCP